MSISYTKVEKTKVESMIQSARVSSLEHYISQQEKFAEKYNGGWWHAFLRKIKVRKFFTPTDNLRGNLVDRWGFLASLQLVMICGDYDDTMDHLEQIETLCKISDGDWVYLTATDSHFLNAWESLK